MHAKYPSIEKRARERQTKKPEDNSRNKCARFEFPLFSFFVHSVHVSGTCDDDDSHNEEQLRMRCAHAQNNETNSKIHMNVIGAARQHEKRPLLLALEAGQLDIARLLLDAHADVDNPNEVFLSLS